MDPFNTMSTATAVRKIPPLREAPPAKVMSCALVASTDLERGLDATKEVTGGADTPSMKMAGRSANSPSHPAMVCGHSPPPPLPGDEGRSPPAHQGSPCARGRGTHLVHTLSPRPTIRKEHQLVMPTRPTTGVLTPRKVTIRHQHVVPLSSSNDDLLLVKHDTRVDLNPNGGRICYTQEPALMSDSPPLSPPPYIVSGQQVGVTYNKVLIPNLAYKGKGRVESASSNPTPRVQRRPPPPKICGLPRAMEFSNELVAVLK
jgi:hypothetical protein